MQGGTLGSFIKIKSSPQLCQRKNIASNTADFLDLISDMNNPDIDEITIEISKKLAEWGGIHPEK